MISYGRPRQDGASDQVNPNQPATSTLPSWLQDFARKNPNYPIYTVPGVAQPVLRPAKAAQTTPGQIPTSPRGRGASPVALPSADPFAAVRKPRYQGTPQGASFIRTFDENGYRYVWNPRMQMYEVVGNTPVTTGTGTGPAAPGGDGDGTSALTRRLEELAAQERGSLLNAWLGEQLPLQEGLRLSRVGETEAVDALRAAQAQSSVGGYGGFRDMGELRIRTPFREQQAGIEEQKVQQYSQYLSAILGVDKRLADALAQAAVANAGKQAAMERAELDRRAKELFASSNAIAVDPESVRYQTRDIESFTGGK